MQSLKITKENAREMSDSNQPSASSMKSDPRLGEKFNKYVNDIDTLIWCACRQGLYSLSFPVVTGFTRIETILNDFGYKVTKSQSTDGLKYVVSWN